MVDNVGNVGSLNVLIPPDFSVVLIPPNIVEGGVMDIALDVNRRGHETRVGDDDDPLGTCG